MKNLSLNATGLLTGLFAALFALSCETSSAQEYTYFYRGIRDLGMGGAGVATVNDETALLINPAALGKLRDFYVTVFDPNVEGGSNSASTIGFNAAKLADPQSALDLANKHPNKNLHEQLRLFPSLVVPNFGVGLYGDYAIDAEVNSATNTFTYNYRKDVSAVFGIDFRIWNGIIKFGATGRYVDRTQISQSSLSSTATGLTFNSLASAGTGLAADAGLLLTAPIAWLPSLGAVYRDAGRTSYSLGPSAITSSSARPDSTPETLDVALAVHPILGNHLRSSWTAQYNGVLSYAKEKDQFRRVHVGAELNFADALFLRAGMNQHYFTAGVELAIVNYQFQFATYGEDIGTPAKPVEDRRIAVKFSFRF